MQKPEIGVDLSNADIAVKLEHSAFQLGRDLNNLRERLLYGDLAVLMRQNPVWVHNLLILELFYLRENADRVQILAELSRHTSDSDEPLDKVSTQLDSLLNLVRFHIFDDSGKSLILATNFLIIIMLTGIIAFLFYFAKHQCQP